MEREPDRAAVVCLGYPRSEQRLVRAACALCSLIFARDNTAVSSLIGGKVQLFLIHVTSDRHDVLDSARQLKRQFPSIPLIVTSTLATLTLAREAIRMRASDFVLLPEEVGYLTACVHRWVSVSQAGTFERRRVLLSPLPLQQSGSNPCALKTQPALDLIWRGFAERLSVATLARACSLTSDGFRRQFKAEHGTTVREYLKRYRINHGARLLRETALSVQEIAFLVGYTDACLFNRLFKRCMGYAPGEWRAAALQQARDGAAGQANPVGASTC